MAKFCANCGKEISEGQDVCLNCGVALNSGSANKVADKKESKGKGLCIAGFVCSLVGFLCCTYVAIPGLVMSIISLVNINNGKCDKSLKWMAIVGIVVGVLGILYMIYNIVSISNGTNQVYNLIEEMFE